MRAPSPHPPPNLPIPLEGRYGYLIIVRRGVSFALFAPRFANASDASTTLRANKCERPTTPPQAELPMTVGGDQKRLAVFNRTGSREGSKHPTSLDAFRTPRDHPNA